jgi:D-alanine--D-alanine ligase
MRIALTHNLRLTNSEDEAEFDSPETIQSLARALSKQGHHVECIDVIGPASRLVTRLELFAPDIAFNIAEGRRGKVRRGFYPALFEELGIPTTGSDAYTLSVTLDKALTKKLLAGYGVPTPRGRFVTRESLKAGGLDELSYPVLAKPNFEGSSKGITQTNIAEDPVELGRVLDELLAAYPDGVLVERYVPGVDVRMVRVEGLAAKLPPVELVVDPSYARRWDILDYALANIDTRFVTRRAPASLPARVIERLHGLADRVFQAFDMRDAAALNFRVGVDGEVYFLSTTALPSLGPDGALAAATAAAGFDYDQTIHAVLRSAAARNGLTALLDATRPRPRARRAALRVGLAFNMKRIDSHDGDDREAEYDAPETIQALTRAIESYGHTVVPLEATMEFPRTLLSSKVDVVFNIAEGISGRNREAQVPNLCELLGVPYTGSDSATLSICLDKALSKRMIRAAERLGGGATRIDTPGFQMLTTGREKLRAFRYPVIVKPNHEGTSKGITSKSVVDDEARLREVAREIIDRYGQPAIVEEYIEGREFTVGLLGERRPRVLPPMEVVFLKGGERPVYDYVCKQDWPNHVRYECPATLTKEELKTMERVCRSTFMTLGCRDVARVDLRLAKDGTVYVIEVNPLPGLTPDYSDLCLIANGAGMDYRTLIGDILSGAIKRWQARQDGSTREPSIEKEAAVEASASATN